MWGSPLQPGSDLTLAIAAWTATVAAATTVVLFAYTHALRYATIQRLRRHRAVVARWRHTLAAATVSAASATDGALPRCSPRERSDLLEEWNSTRASVDGDAIANLIVLAERLGFLALARKMLRRRKLG